MQKEVSPRGRNRDVWEQMAQAAVAVLDAALQLHLMLGTSGSPRFTILGTTGSGTSGRVLARSKRTAHNPCTRAFLAGKRGS